MSYNNSLSGAIPAEIGDLTRLEGLWLYNNSLSGDIPAEIGNLTSLEGLWLGNNSLSGAMPAEIANLTSLEGLGLGHNTELTGELPAGLRLLPINYLDIRETCIATPADSDFQAWLAGITFLDTDRACAAGVTVTPTTLSVPEGSNAKYTVVLDAQPSADVTITLSLASGSDTDITIDKPSLTFTTDNWDAAQEVTVSAAEDNDAADGEATIEHTASGGGYGGVSVSSVTATEADNDNDVDAERAALVAIYDATDGDNWTDNTNWKSEKPVGDWYGVTVENGVVTKLDLSDNNLRGELPVEIGDLTSLERLELVNNSLSGAIPAEIGNLTRLGVLLLQLNSLSGKIPEEIENLTSLWSLDIAGNSLNGSIPAEIGNLTRLMALTFSFNSLSGAIPAEIGNLTSLELLDLQANSLSGAIPSEIENLTSLKVLHLNSNTELTGELPAGLRLLPVTTLDIQNTCITTPADSNFQAWLAGITFLDTDRACAAGVTVTPTTLSVPEGSNAKYTVVLDTQPSADVTISVSLAAGSDMDITVDKTSLTFTTDNWNAAQEVTVSAAEDDDATDGAATIEHAASGGGYGGVSVSSVTATEADNDNDADAERAALVAIYDATDGDNWTDNTNWKSEEPVGDWYGVTVENGVVTGLNITENALSGEIPSEIGDLTSLERLNLSANNLIGAIPSSIGDLTALEELWLYGNILTGGIPSSISNLAALESLWLSSNALTGRIPSGIGDLTALENLWLSNNALTGRIPSGIGDLTALENLHLSDNDLTGGIPSSIGDLTALESLLLASNDLTGGIPSSIGDLTALKYLWLYGNDLTGKIPSGIGDLTALEELRLNDNDLTGEIPESFSNLVNLSTFYAGGTNNVCIPSGLQSWHNGISERDSLPECASSPPSPTVSVTPETLSVTEGAGSAQLTLELSEVLSDPVTVDWATSDGTAAAGSDYTAGDGTVNFAPNETRKTIDIAITDDALDESDETFTVTLSNPSNAELGVAKTATVTIADNDTRGVAISPTTLTITEGTSKTYEVVLNTQPTGDVTVTPSLATGSDADVTLASSSALTFTSLNWDTVQTVTVNAAEDNDAAPGVATIEHAVAGADYAGVTASDVTVTEADNDMPEVTITPTSLTVAEGDSVKYTVVLATKPSGNVTISLSFASGSDEDITVDKTSLTFTPENWDAAQEITVSAAEDDDAINGAATIEHTVSGEGYGGVTVSSVTATEADNDTAGVTVTPTALTVPEGSNVKYTVVFDTQPSEEVTISLSFASGSDEDITADKTSLTFTMDNWSTAQEITVLAAEDDDALNGVATIEHTAAGGGYGDVTISSVAATEEDNDTRGVTVTPTALSVTEGSNAKYTVVLDTQPSDDVTITASFAAGSDEDITVDKTSLTFTSDNWSIAQEVTVSAAVDNDTDDDAAVLNHNASGGDYGEVTVADVVVTVTDVIGGVDVSAWLARYSRVGADHLLSSVENRMESIGRGASGAEASVAGQRIVFGDSPARPGMELSGSSALWSASQDYLTASASMDGGDGGRSGNSYGISPGLNAAASRYRNMTLRDALSRSAFRYTRETSWGNSLGVWGQGAFSRFGGSEAGADLTGDVMSGTVGIDNSFSGWLHGLAVSRSESEGAYRIAGEDSLSLSASLTGVYPYARYNLTDRLRVWGTGGYGSGSLRLQGDSLASSTSDLSMTLGSVGMSGDIVSAGSSGGFGLSWQTDAMLLRSSLASSDALSAVSAMVYRLRLSLESSYILRMGDRASLAPKVQLGVRQDGGDAEQGMGMDVAGGLGFIHSGWGLQAQVDMHGLVAHEDSDFEEWGVSGMILFDRSPSSELGMSLRLTPSWGSASSSMGGMRALWSRETVSGLAGFRRTGDDRSLRLDSRFDYGFTAGEHGVASPYASFSLSGSEARGAVADTGVELGGGLGYSNQSLGLRMQAGVRGLMSDEAMALDRWGASGVVAFDPDPSSPLGASFNVSQSWGITPRTGFGGSQTMGAMREREPLPRSVTGLSRSNLYGQPMRIEGEMGYGFSASGGKGVATPYAGVAFSDRGRSGLLLGLNLQAGRRFLLNVEGSTPKVRAISFDSMPEFRVRGLLKW